MSIEARFRSALAPAFAAAAIWFVAGVALAQTPAALPTAPGADRGASQSQVPATAAKASLPGDNDSPLEPYLFTFILLGGGLICLIAVVVTNNALVTGYTTDKKHLE